MTATADPHHIPICDDPDCLGCEWAEDGPTVIASGIAPDFADWLRTAVGATVVNPTSN